ncbi:hypothetical protein HDZ31DRAFT_76332 [Schizophyllum fasciatum]
MPITINHHDELGYEITPVETRFTDDARPTSCRHTFTLLWAHKRIGTLGTAAMWVQTVARDADPSAHLDPVILARETSGPVRIILARTAPEPPKPLSSSVLKVMDTLAARVDELEVRAPWAVAAPAMGRMGLAERLAFAGGDLEELRALLGVLGTPQGDGVPGMRLLGVLRITCGEGCELDKMVHGLVARGSMLRGSRLRVIYCTPRRRWPRSVHIQNAQGQLARVGVELRFEDL